MQVRSFDIFETCLARRVAVPTDVILLVARCLAVIRKVDPSAEFVDEVAWARIRGEQIARAKEASGEPTLEQIWRETEALVGWEPSDVHIQTELKVEEELLYPIPEVLRRIGRAREEGHRVIFVTDTYFPESFLRRVLTRGGCLRPGDGLYVSCIVGASKAAGSLFPFVVEAEGGPPSRILHLGDNPRSDVTRPREAGLRADLLTPTQPTRIESAVRRASDLPKLSTSRWVGALRQARLQASAARGSDLGSRLVAPFLFAFVAWVLAEAQRGGVRRLYFVSRDGRIASEMARVLSPEFDDIDVRYLYTSRQALLLPTVGEISPRGMPWMQRSWEQPELRRLLAKIELDPAEKAWSGLTEGSGPEFQLTTDEHWDRFWKILSGPEIGPKLRAGAQVRREAAVAYLRSAGLFDEVPKALVDLGWTLNSQAAMNRLLGREDAISGYYLYLANNRVPRPLSGPARSLFSPTPNDRLRLDPRREPSSWAGVLEFTLGLADHPSVHHYEFDQDGTPVPAVAGGPLRCDATALFDSVLRSAVRFTERNRAQVHDLVPNHYVARGVLRRFLDEVLVDPPEPLVRDLEGLRESSDQAHRWTQPIVRPLTIREELPALLPMGSSRQAMRVDESPWWREGSEILTPRWVLGGRRIVLGLRAGAKRIWSKVARRLPSTATRHIRKWLRRS